MKDNIEFLKVPIVVKIQILMTYVYNTFGEIIQIAYYFLLGYIETDTLVNLFINMADQLTYIFTAVYIS